MIEMLVTSSVLILAICLIRKLFKGKMNPKLQYALWILVIIRLIPFGMVSNLQAPQMESKASVMNLVTMVQNTTTTENKAEGDLLQSENNQVITNQNKVLVHTIATYFYIIGILASSCWFLYVNISFAGNLKKNRKLITNTEYQLPVYVVHNLKTSCVFMVKGRCGIYLSEECASNQDQVRYVVAHELSHYNHFDHIWSMIRCVLLVFYWFDPFVWLAAHLSKQDCEMACDTAAIKQLGEKERLNYGKTLVDIAFTQNESRTVMNLATSMSENNRGLKQRIQQIAKKPKMVVSSVIIVALIIVSVVTVTFTTNVHSVAETKMKAVASPSATPDNHLEKEINKVEAYVEKYLKTGKDDYSMENCCFDGFNTKNRSVSYDSFKGIKRVGKITAKEATKLKGKYNSSGELVCFILISPSKVWSSCGSRGEVELSIEKGDTTLLIAGDVGKGKVSIDYEANDKVSYEAQLDDLFINNN